MSLDIIKLREKVVNKTTTQNFKKALEEIKEKEVRTHRIVRLVFKSCCGCGCSDVQIERQVPYDSPLHNGDRISKLEQWDKQV